MNLSDNPPPAPQAAHFALKGLRAPVMIRVDEWGLAHIEAENEDDLFFAQGFNAARDRLWQIDLWRKKGLGRLAEDFGPGFLAQDYASRLFLYRGDMAAEWAAYSAGGDDPEGPRRICEAFAAGINAFVSLTERRPERLPAEFRATNTRPAYWRAADVVRIRSHAISQNALSEIARAQALAAGDGDLDPFRRRLTPPVEPLWDGAPAPPSAAADWLRLATAEPTLSPERLGASLDDAWDWTGVDEYGAVVRRAQARPPDEIVEGSNNWIVTPDRSTTGRPILANDPHRALRNPSLRYLVHLKAPGLDVIGAGEPFLPGISIGHNGRTAFGLTIFYIDQEDLLRLDTSADGARYAFAGASRPFETRAEYFAVRGAPAQTLAAKYARGAPVLAQTQSQAFALRSVWFEPGAAPYARSLAAMRARDADEFRDLVRGWGTPAVNHVAADAAGATLWAPSGFWPARRPGHDGLTPVAGDGRFDWDGMRDPEELPRVKNPARGWFATANEMNLPADFPHVRDGRAGDRVVGYEWFDRARADRIAEFLNARAKISLEDCAALQTDLHSLPARALLALLAPLKATGETGRALRLLAGWNAVLEADSAAAALYEVWIVRHLRPALLERLAGAGETGAARRARLGAGDMESLIDALERADPRLGTAAEQADLLKASLASAWSEAERRLGPLPVRWRWGDLHRMRFEHALAGAGLPPAGPPLPMGGDISSVMNLMARADNFDVCVGASLRLIVDVGDWDRSLAINAPGQSGDPASPHYADLAPLWAKGGYFPLLYSPERIARATRATIRLAPDPA